MYTVHVFVGYNIFLYSDCLLLIVKIVKNVLTGSYLIEYSVAWCIWAIMNSFETDKYLLYDIFIEFWCFLVGMHL